MLVLCVFVNTFFVPWGQIYSPVKLDKNTAVEGENSRVLRIERRRFIITYSITKSPCFGWGGGGDINSHTPHLIEIFSRHVHNNSLVSSQSDELESNK